MRDGLARMDDATITVDSLSNEPREGGEWLTITGTADVAYRLSDEEAIASLVEQGYTQDEAEALESLADGDEGHYLTILDWSYSVERVGDGWLIRAYDLDVGVDHRGRLAGLSRPARRRSQLDTRLLLLDRRDDQSDDRRDDRSRDSSADQIAGDARDVEARVRGWPGRSALPPAPPTAPRIPLMTGPSVFFLTPAPAPMPPSAPPMIPMIHSMCEPPSREAPLLRVATDASSGSVRGGPFWERVERCGA